MNPGRKEFPPIEGQGRGLAAKGSPTHQGKVSKKNRLRNQTHKDRRSSSDERYTKF